MTRADLNASTRKELAQLAKQHRVAGWHAMRKEQLVDALTRVIRKKKTQESRKSNTTDKRPSNGTPHHARESNRTHPARNGERRPLRLAADQAGRRQQGAPRSKDQLVAEARDPYWIHVRWNLSQEILDRAEAALGTEWHSAIPVIRLFDVTEGDETAGTKSWVGDTDIQTDSDNWYIPIAKSPRTYKLQIGYRAPSGRFFMLARSRKLTTPRPNGLSARLSEASARPGNNGQAGPARKFAASEPAEAVGTRHTRAEHYRDSRPESQNAGDVSFQVEAEVAIHGYAHPLSKLTLSGEPVDTAADGSFTVKFTLAEGRQVIPAVMLTPNGNERHTIVLAIERNTKHLEPQSLDEMM